MSHETRRNEEIRAASLILTYPLKQLQHINPAKFAAWRESACPGMAYAGCDTPLGGRHQEYVEIGVNDEGLLTVLLEGDTVLYAGKDAEEAINIYHEIAQRRIPKGEALPGFTTKKYIPLD